MNLVYRGLIKNVVIMVIKVVTIEITKSLDSSILVVNRCLTRIFPH